MNTMSEVIKRMIQHFGDDVRRINHALKVFGLAKCIGESERLEEVKQQILEAAAVLHDIGIKESEIKYQSSAGKYQEIEGPPIAEKILGELGYEKEFVDRVCFLVGNHHTYGNIDGTDFQILVEADFLVNIFEDGMDGKQKATIKDKYFKTRTGTMILDSMFSEE
ncbi:MAG: HD domain-containing protein [Clostridia bacterium]|nr:HD domain-containing protein [Clostridia bacterium]